MKTLIAAMVLSTGVSFPALALDLDTRFSESFIESLADEYGEKEGTYLTEKLELRVTNALEQADLDIAKIELVIEDAKPNRPTFEQLSARPGLSYVHSKSIGGAKVSGSAFGENGELIGEFSYDWYESSIANVVGAGTWSDANRVFRRFASRFADSLIEES